MSKPKLYDIVINKLSNIQGIVIAAYPYAEPSPGKGKYVNGVEVIDVCIDDERVWYESPIENWEVVFGYKEKFE